MLSKIFYNNIDEVNFNFKMNITFKRQNFVIKDIYVQIATSWPKFIFICDAKYFLNKVLPTPISCCCGR